MKKVPFGTLNPDALHMAECRKRLGLTQVEFSILIGVHPITVSKWERGQAEPSSWHYCLAAHLHSHQKNISEMLTCRGAIFTLAHLLQKFART